MDSILNTAIENLTSPVVLFFALGIIIAFLKAKVEIPEAVMNFIGIYLLIAIGLKGGVEIAHAGFNSVFMTILGALFLGIIIPVYSFFLLWRFGKLKSYDAAAIAGHYGSISVVTFMAATAFLNKLEIKYEGFVNGLPALMETPAIIVALFLAIWAKQKGKEGQGASSISLGESAKKVLLSKGVILLIGAMLVGYFTGPEGMKSVEFFYQDIFMGLLSIFMLEMGIVAGRKLSEFREAGIALILFALITPLFNGMLGIATGFLAGLSLGGITLLGVLAASSSYIVAPAAMRVSLPKANPAFYLGASLGVTLPFNLIIGIPVYYYAAVSLVKLFG